MKLCDLRYWTASNADQGLIVLLGGAQPPPAGSWKTIKAVMLEKA